MSASPRATEISTSLRPPAVAEAAAAPSSVPLAFDFLDLKAQFATIREEVMAAVTGVMESQHFILGPEVRQFEEEIQRMLEVPYAVSCASGSDALVLALLAAGIGPGDEVITTPFTFVATGTSIARTGAKPVFVDIDPKTFNIDAAQVEAAITERTRAIMPVHLFGLSAEMDPILRVANAKELVVIEDAAQAIGATYHGRHIGGLGTFGCFSFFPSKNLGGAGDGGLVATNDAGHADRLRLLRVHGSRTKYRHEILGTNSRLDALQAAILRVKLRHLDSWTGARRHRAERYRTLVADMRLTGYIQVPEEQANSRHVYNQFSIRCRERDALRDYLRNAGIPSEIYYPLALHLQPAFSYLEYKPGQFPMAEAASHEVLSLPVYPELKEAQQETVVRAIADFFATKS